MMMMMRKRIDENDCHCDNGKEEEEEVHVVFGNSL
jgi:hypothetical protein